MFCVPGDVRNPMVSISGQSEAYTVVRGRKTKFGVFYQNEAWESVRIFCHFDRFFPVFTEVFDFEAR